MTLSIIVATAKDGVIGKSGGLPWYLPAELAYFKNTTMGHSIIMGRKTHESIGRALPGRTNIVITRDPNYQAEGCRVVTSLDEAIKVADAQNEVFIIGGESIYAQAIDKTDRIYLTQVNADIKGDKYFKFDPGSWQEVSRQEHKADERNEYDYAFTVLERKR